MTDWLGKPYYSLDAYLKKTFGEKVYKLSLDGGMTCPNRDGTCGDRGCIFCSAGGSGDFAESAADDYADGVSGVRAGVDQCVQNLQRGVLHRGRIPGLLGVHPAKLHEQHVRQAELPVGDGGGLFLRPDRVRAVRRAVLPAKASRARAELR